MDYGRPDPLNRADIPGVAAGGYHERLDPHSQGDRNAAIGSTRVARHVARRQRDDEQHASGSPVPNAVWAATGYVFLGERSRSYVYGLTLTLADAW
jgi:hypothetical protein